MKAFVSHIQLNVSSKEKSFPFYKDLLQYLGYRFICEDSDYFGMANGTTDFWIEAVKPKYQDRVFHRKGPGLNHIAFRVLLKDEVDKFCTEFLRPRDILTLYDSPKPFPEYGKDYYAVYFEDPDRVKLEVVYF